MLTDRQRQILTAVVEMFVDDAEPVGSRTIAKRDDVGYSAATVRNDMADLEDLGFIEQPHTSAGRIPTNKGYRFYVDHLVTPRKVNVRDMEMIRRHFAHKIDEIEQAFQQTATIISELTNYTSIVLGPEMFQSTLKHIQVVPLSDRAAVAIMVTNTGHVEKRNIIFPDETSFNSLDILINLLNDKLVGVPLYRIRSKMYAEISKELARHAEHFEALLEVVNQMFTSEYDRVFMGGTTNLMAQPEFHDVRQVKLIFDLFQNKDVILKLFGLDEAGLHVSIGQENQLEAVQNCSIITASYTIEGEQVGSIGVLGPTRMDYSKLMGLMDYLSHDMSRVIHRLYSGL